jgi:hypothetical protein
MSIEDRLRRVLADAVADEPPLRGAPLEAALRRRRRRPVLAGVVAMVLVLAAVVALAAVRGQRERTPVGPTPTTTPSTASTKGWKTFTDTTGYLRFRYPPDWALRRLPKQDDAVELVPPEDADRPGEQARFQVRILPNATFFWVGEMWSGVTTRGRLPNGQAYLLDVKGPTAASGPGAYGNGVYSIDWGRYCTKGGGRRFCGPHSVLVSFGGSSSAAWARYRAVADTIARTATQLRPTGPSVGDRSRRACRADQWRLVWPEEYAMGNDGQRFVLQGGVQYRQGPRCHLRLTLRLAVQDKDGQPLPVRGNPTTTTVEGDLPEDGMQRLQGSWVIDGAFMWRFAWEEWCNQGLPVATLRVIAAGGATLTVPGPRPPRARGNRLPASLTCHDRGRPSTVAGWPP